MKEYQVVIGVRLPENIVQQIASVHPGLRLQFVGDEMAALLGRQVRGLPGMREREEVNKTQAEARLNAVLAEAEIYYGLRVLPDMLHRAPNLRWVQFSSHGVDHLRGDVLVQEEVIVTTGRGNYASVIAEHVFGMMLMLSRDFVKMLGRQKEHSWERRIQAVELKGKTFGLVGLGSIGQEVAQRSRAFGMRIIATKRTVPDPSVPRGLVDELIPSSNLEHLLTESDFVLLSLPSTGETKSYLKEPQLRAMKPTAFLLNVGRGDAVEEEALIKALQEGWIAGAGLDVFRREPLPPESPLWDMPNVIITPHTAGFSERFLERATGTFIQNLRRYVSGEPMINVLDRRRGY